MGKLCICVIWNNDITRFDVEQIKEFICDEIEVVCIVRDKFTRNTELLNVLQKEIKIYEYSSIEQIKFILNDLRFEKISFYYGKCWVGKQFYKYLLEESWNQDVVLGKTESIYLNRGKLNLKCDEIENNPIVHENFQAALFDKFYIRKNLEMISKAIYTMDILCWIKIVFNDNTFYCKKEEMFLYAPLVLGLKKEDDKNKICPRVYGVFKYIKYNNGNKIVFYSMVRMLSYFVDCYLENKISNYSKEDISWSDIESIYKRIVIEQKKFGLEFPDYFEEFYIQYFANQSTREVWNKRTEIEDYPAVSVIIPVYNVERYIRKRIESIIGQTLKEIEIICIDDGSTDNSGEILDEYAKKDSRIKVVHAAHSDAGNARNIGIQMARGQYLAILDADDWSEKNMLQRLYLEGIKKDADIVVCRSRAYSEEHQVYSNQDGAIKVKLLPEKDVFSFWDCKEDIFQIFVAWSWDRIIRRDIVVDNNLFFQKLRTANAASFSCATLVVAKKIAFINEYLTIQRRDLNTSLTHTLDQSWKCAFYSIMDLKRILIELGIYKDVEVSYLVWSVHTLLWYVMKMQNNYVISKQLHEKLRNTYFEMAGITTSKTEFSHKNSKEYERYQEILNLEFEEFQFKELQKIRIDNEHMKQENMLLVNNKKANEDKLIEQDKEHNKRLSQLKKLEIMLYEARKEVLELKKSTMFKVGEFVTNLPRRLKIERIRNIEKKKRKKKGCLNIAIVAYENFHYFILNSIIQICNVSKNHVEVYAPQKAINEMRIYMKDDFNKVEWVPIPWCNYVGDSNRGEFNEELLCDLSKKIAENPFLDKIITCSSEYKYHLYKTLYINAKYADVIALIHNVNAIFRSKKFNYEKYMLFKKVDAYAVLGEQLKEEIEKNKLTRKKVYVFPIIHNKEQSEIRVQNERKTRFVVVGHVQKERKNYNLILDSFEKLRNSYDEIQLTILGSTETEYGKRIVERCKELRRRGMDIKWFDGFVPTKEFKYYMEKADYLLGAVEVFTNTSESNEIYGVTKMTGVETDMIEYALPGIIPSQLKIQTDLKNCVLTYEREEQLFDVLKKSLDSNKKHELKQNAILCARKHSKENNYIKF